MKALECPLCMACLKHRNDSYEGTYGDTFYARYWYCPDCAFTARPSGWHDRKGEAVKAAAKNAHAAVDGVIMWQVNGGEDIPF